MPKTFRSQEQIVPMGTFVPETFRSPELSFPWERKFPGTFVHGPFRSRELSFPGNESSWELSFPGPFVPRNFRSQDFSFPGTFVPPTIYKALAMNADSYSNCQNLFRSRPSSVCFPKINLVSLRCVHVVFFSVK